MGRRLTRAFLGVLLVALVVPLHSFAQDAGDGDDGDGDSPPAVAGVKTPDKSDQSQSGKHKSSDYILTNCAPADGEKRGTLHGQVVCVLEDLHCDEALVSEPNSTARMKGIIAYCHPDSKTNRCPGSNDCVGDKTIDADDAHASIKMDAPKTGDVTCAPDKAAQANGDQPTTAAANSTASASNTQTRHPKKAKDVK